MRKDRRTTPVTQGALEPEVCCKQRAAQQGHGHVPFSSAIGNVFHPHCKQRTASTSQTLRLLSVLAEMSSLLDKKRTYDTALLWPRNVNSLEGSREERQEGGEKGGRGSQRSAWMREAREQQRKGQGKPPLGAGCGGRSSARGGPPSQRQCCGRFRGET